MTDLTKRLAAEHVQWTYEVNGTTLPVSRFRDPNTGELPEQYEQCRECKKAWPCETRQLLDLIESKAS